MVSGMAGEKRAAVAGVTGFVGRGLPGLLGARGFAVTGISRGEKAGIPGIDRWQKPETLDFSGHQVVINLAGEPVNQRWTAEAKRRFRESRVDYTEKIVGAIRRLPEADRPRVLVNASAVGYYGDRGDDFLIETAGPGAGYLADLCRDWEAAAQGAADLGVRTVLVRIGMVLGKEGGAFRQLRGIFKWGIGGRLGHGRQWMPWVHLDDLRAAIIHAAVSETLEGPVNGTAPAPERNADFTRKLAAALHRPAFLPVPAFPLKLAFGEFAGALFDSERAVPSALVSDGFQFRFNRLEDALGNLTS